MSGYRGDQWLSFEEVLLACAGAVLLAGLLLAADRVGIYGAGRIPYANGGSCDSWYYYSLIISPQSGSMLAEGTRFISRPLYFAPVHLLKELLPGLDPNMASYLVFFPLAVSALYLGLRAYFAPTTSLAATVLVGSAPLLINMASETYVPMGAAAYANCTLASLMWTGRVAGARPAAHLVTAFLAGAFFIFAANANMMAIEFDSFYVLFALPLPLLAGINGLSRATISLVVRAAGAFLTGAAAAIVFTMALSHFLKLGFSTPFKQVIEAIAGIDQSRDAGWRHDTVAFALIGTIVLLCALACYRVRGRTDILAGRVRLIAVVAVGTCLFHLISFSAFGNMSLAFDWWYFLLLPCVALALCAALTELIEAGQKPAIAALVGTILAANVALSQFRELKLFLFGDSQLVSYAIVAVLAALVFWRRKRANVAVLLALTVLVLQAANGSITHQHYFRALEDERNLAQATERAVDFIVAHTPDKPVVWIADADNHRLDLSIFRSLIRCTFERSFPAKLPDPEIHWQAALEPGRTLLVIDGNASPQTAIQAALAVHGLALDVSASRHIALAAGTAAGVQLTIGRVR